MKATVNGIAVNYTLEGPANADHEHNRENPCAAQKRSRGPDGEQSRGEPGHRHGHCDEAPSIVAVGQMAGHQHQQEGRDELDETDEAEVERIAGQVVHLPSHRDRLHGERKGGAEASDPELDERPLAQQGGRGIGHHFSLWD